MPTDDQGDLPRAPIERFVHGEMITVDRMNQLVDTINYLLGASTPSSADEVESDG